VGGFLRPWILPLIRRTRRRRRRSRPRSPLLRATVYWGFVAGLWLVMGLIGALAYFAAGLPDTGSLWRAKAGPSIIVVDATGQTLVTRGASAGDDLKLKDMSPYLPLAVLAIEDRRFYTHWGVDLFGVMRAAFTNIEEGHVVQGGSTLTQQLAKNVFLTPERSFKRKIQEALLAIWLESRFSKDEILQLYLNRVYLGAGTYGVDAASRRYFDKPPKALTLAESAMIAGLLKAPSRYAPTNDPQAAAKRTGLVLDAMVEAGFINPEKRKSVHEDKLAFAHGTQSQGALYFVDWVLDTLPSFIGPERGELIVETTLHLPFQRAAERAVGEVLRRDGPKHDAGQAALVAIDAGGAIRAMVGGGSYEAAPFNRAVNAQRQPGSAFKPFVYLAALERGYGPQSPVLDAPISIGKWHPANFEGSFRGTVNFQSALALSLNTAAVRIGQQVGHDAVVAVARRLGITSPLPGNSSIFLGSAEVNLLEISSAYLPFATGGDAPPVYAIRRVIRRDGKLLYKHPPTGTARVISAYNAGAMNAMLEAVVDWGTGHAAKLQARACAGKTGTSQDYRDAWFIGYTPDLVAGVWVGNDNNTPMKKVTGGSLPAEIWKSFMGQAALAYPPRPLPDGGYRPESEAQIAAKAADTGEKKPTRLLSFFERLGRILNGDDDKR
jgi:penicillin-binding protein 1A